MAFHRFVKRLRARSGQQLVEMAVVLPVIVLCIGIIITAGQIMWGRMVVQMAAYEGARKAVVSSTESTGKANAFGKAQEIVGANGIGLTLVNNNSSYGWNLDGSWRKGSYVTYQVTGTVKTLFPVFFDGWRLENQFPVVGKIVMMVENG